MKTLKLLSLLIIGFCVTTLSAQSSTGTDLFIILEKEGDAIIKSTDGRLFEAEPATYLYKGNTLILGTNSYVMLHYGLLTMQITDAGEYVLNDELFEDVLTDGGEFDPLFADFTAFSINILTDAIAHGNWSISSTKKGDGWGSKDEKKKGGWGSKDQKKVGGWGSKDEKKKGAWGANSLQSKSGLGVIPPSGWGSKDEKKKGGWGSKDQKKKGGWGSKDEKKKGGWGSKDQKKKGGWGTDDPRAKGAWGSKDEKKKGGWGVELMTIESKSPGGFYLPNITKLNWVAEDDVAQYLFVIADDNENMIYSEISKSNEIEFDFSTLEKGEQYFWQIFADGKEAISEPVSFVIKSYDNLNEKMKNCRSSSNYKIAGNALKGLMKLYVLEQEGYYLHAYNKYNYLLKKHPSNDLVKINYSSFALRLGQYENAKSIAEKI